MKKSIRLFLVTMTMGVAFSAAVSAASGTPREQYGAILDLYAQGAQEAWGQEEFIAHGLPYVYGYEPGNMGYTFMDINGDGVEEMLTGICVTHAADADPKYGNCLDLYTIVNGQPVGLGQGGERYRYSACGDGTVASFWSGGAANSGWDYFTISEDGRLEQFMVIGSNYSEESGDIYYFKNTAEPFDKLDGETISREEYDRIADGFTYLPLDFTPITAYTKQGVQAGSGQTVQGQTGSAQTGSASSGYSGGTTVPFYGVWCLGTKSERDAWSYVNQLHTQGLPASVYLTTQWSDLNAEPWYVVSAGEYSTESAANSFLARVKQYCPDAYVKWTGSFIG